MNILNLDSISKSYGEKLLFDTISLGIEAGERLGLIGVNGSGKSTLLKIMAGLEPPDAGNIVVRSGVRVGYLPQVPIFAVDQTVLDYVYHADSAALDLLRRYEQATQQLVRTPDDVTILHTVADLSDQISAADGWDGERAAKTILSQLGITDYAAHTATLSGGQRKRVALARVLIDKPDLLLLDEPTNHLDPDTIAWLEGYLASTTTTLLLITHDRYFLDRVVTRIIELDDRRLYSYPGNYERFVTARRERTDRDLRDETARQNAIRREQAWLQRGAQGRTTKQKARIERATTLIEAEGPTQQQALELELRGRRIGKRIIELQHLSKQIDGHMLFSDLSYDLARDARLGIIGPNGSGKSTLLNLIAGRTQPDTGAVVIGETIHLAYYDQTSSELDSRQRVIEYVTDAAAIIPTADGGTITAHQMLERFLFPPQQHWALVGSLSGGERRRLYLLRTLLSNPNVLLLDEPTNDLDVPTLHVLEEYLDTFPGAVVVVSHDRAFLDNTVDHLLVFGGDGTVRHFPGNYGAYRSQQQHQTTHTAAPSQPSLSTSRRTERSPKLSFGEQRELTQLEQRIAALEQEQHRITNAINTAGTDYHLFAELTSQLDQLTHTLEATLERWMELAERAEASQSATA